MSESHRQNEIPPVNWGPIGLIVLTFVLAATWSGFLSDGDFLIFIPKTTAVVAAGYVAIYGLVFGQFSPTSRLTIAGIAAVSAGAAWVFLPTTQGVNLWTAYSERQRIENAFGSLQTLDVEAAIALDHSVTNLNKQFPGMAQSWRAARSDWINASVNELRKQLRETKPGDIPAFKTCRSLSRELAQKFGRAPSVREVEELWVTRTIEGYVAEARRSLATDSGNAYQQFCESISKMHTMGYASQLKLQLEARLEIANTFIELSRNEAADDIRKSQLENARSRFAKPTNEVVAEFDRLGLASEWNATANNLQYLVEFSQVGS